MPALVDKYRPDNFADVIGQQHIIKILTNILKDPNKYPSAIILNGPFGVGKTTIARIFATELSKIRKSHIYEFDGSIIGNKESLKDIKNRIDSVFKFSKDFRVLIFDEMHRTLKISQDLFLKTLEDNIIDGSSVRNIYFFFVTTDSSKFIDTLKSRCIELNFYLISNEDIFNRIKYISEKENININENDINRIVDSSKGHLRDAIINLDVYSISKENFNELLFNTQRMLYDFIFKGIDNIKKISIVPVNILIVDLNTIVLKYVDHTLDNNFFETLQFLELYFKYKNYISTIEDFTAVIKILSKFNKLKKA